MAVFVSWRGSDREVKNKLVEKLRQELDPSMEIWESDMGCTSDFSADCMEAIRKSEVFVIIISDAAMEPSYVFNELIEARQMEMQGKLNIVMFKITDSPLTDSFKANLNHISDANHVGRLNGDDSGFDACAHKVKNLISKRRNNNPEKPYDVLKPIVEGLPLCAPEYFAMGSRDDVFADFDEAFSRSNIVFTTKMSGYGRKSAAYMYANLHKAEYEDIKVLRFFSGSLKKFLTNGVNFTNVNSNVFEDLNDEKIIMKVVEFMAKMDSKTLLIVPNVVIDDADDRTVLEAVSGIGARVIFIAQTVPDSVSRSFPVVSIGRMKNNYLREIFFNYYDEADEEAQEKLAEPLDEFFNAIDGHTKTVELTAVTLSEELGVYPEDIPDILKRICSGGGDELSERISCLIADLFDTNAFTDVEKGILYITSLVAGVPIDEKEYSDLLKHCDSFDAKAFKRLVDLKWIDFDKMSHTITMDSFLIKVCEMKDMADEEILAACLTYYNDKLLEYISKIEVGIKFYATAVRTARLLSVAGAGCTAKALEEVLTTEGINYLNNGYAKELLNGMEEELNDMDEDWECYEPISSIRTLINIIGIQIINITDVHAAKGGNNLIIGNIVTQLSDLIDDFGNEVGIRFEELPGYDSVPEIIREITEAIGKKDIEKVIMLFVHIDRESIQEFRSWMDENVDEDESVIKLLIGDFISNLPRQLMDSFAKQPYICAKLCEKRILWAQYYENYKSPFDATSTYYHYAYSLSELGRDRNDVVDAYETGMGFFKSLLADRSLEAQEKSLVIAEYLCEYCRYIRDNSIKNNCDKIIEYLINLKHVTGDGIVSLRECYRMISDILLNSFSTVEWEEFYLKLDLKALKSLAAGDDDDISARETVAFAEEMEEMHSLLLSERTTGNTDNESVEYMNYYATFAKESVKKGLVKKYMDIANNVLKSDYSKLSDEEIKKEFSLLRDAKPGVNLVSRYAEKTFALVNEAVKRTLGYSLHFVQYLGALAIAEGNISEMQNGEGKTVTIALAAILLSLSGKKVHILDSSLYLTRRNFRWMYDLYEKIGLSTTIIDADRSGDMARNEFPEIYNSDIVYVHIAGGMFTDMGINVNADLYRIPHEILIVDEADQLMVSNATQLYSSVSNKKNGTNIYGLIADLVKSIEPDKEEYYSLDARGNMVLTDKMYEAAENYFNLKYEVADNQFREQTKTLLRECIWAFYIMKKDKDYFVQKGEIRREDTFTGSFGPFAKSTDFFLRVRENIPINPEKYTEKTVNDSYEVMEYIKQYEYICGASATACSMVKEFREVYGMEVVSIPTEKPIQRKDYAPVLLTKKEYKLDRIIEEVSERNKIGQPILIVTGSVAESELVSSRLFKAGILHVLLNARNEEEQVELLSMAGSIGSVTVTTAMANRGVDIRLGGNAEELAKEAVLKAGVSLEDFESMYSSNKRNEVGYVKMEYLKALKRYREITEPQRVEVEELGGLCVIGTECFDDLRVEQQMRGRAGRQGCKGESMLFYSLEDESLRSLLSEGFIKMFDDSYSDIEFSNGFITKSLERARERIQNARYRQLVDNPQSEIVATARKAFFDIKESMKEQGNGLELIKKFLSSYQKYIDMVKQYEKNPEAGYKLPFGKDYFDAHKGRHREKEIGEMLFRAWCEDQKGRLTEIVAKGNFELFYDYPVRMIICKNWSDYLKNYEDRKRSISSEANLGRNSVNKVLSEYSKNLTEELIEKTFVSVITINIKK